MVQTILSSSLDKRLSLTLSHAEAFALSEETVLSVVQGPSLLTAVVLA